LLMPFNMRVDGTAIYSGFPIAYTLIVKQYIINDL